MSKKSKNSETGDESLLDKIIKTAGDKYNIKFIETLEEMVERPSIVYSTGSIGLDYVISAPMGGMEAGRLLEIYGDYSTGKTTLALQLCANVIANGKKAVFIDAEKAFQKSMAVNMGLNTPDKKGMFNILIKGDPREQANLLSKMLPTNEIGIIVLDSLPSWNPQPEGKKNEADPDITKPKMAEKALFLSQIIPILNDYCYDANCIFVILNQVRANMSGYGADTKRYELKAVEHHISTLLHLSGTARSKSAQILGPGDKVIGQQVTVKSEKNKLDVPMKSIQIPIILGQGVNPFMEVADLAIQEKLIERSGAWYYFNDLKANGINNLYELLFQDKEMYKTLRQQVIEKLGIVYSPNVKIFNPFIKDE
jgi:recombination protein RecA